MKNPTRDTPRSSNILTGNLLAFFFDEVGVGTAGNVTINADHLQMTGANIVTDVTDFVNFGGKSGGITITGHDITLDGSSFSSTGGVGSGNITISADQLIATTSGIQAITTSGPGGEVRITGNVIELRLGTTIASTTNGDGNAGPIIINATDHLGILESLELGPNAQVSGLFTNSFGDVGGSHGNAGDVVITTPRLQLTGGSRIDTSTASSGHGGNITINANSITMSGETVGLAGDTLFNLGSSQSSGIYSRTIGGNCIGLCGNAGNISITAGSLTTGSGAQINSGSSSNGQGGDISITASNTIALSGT